MCTYGWSCIFIFIVTYLIKSLICKIINIFESFSLSLEIRRVTFPAVPATRRLMFCIYSDINVGNKQKNIKVDDRDFVAYDNYRVQLPNPLFVINDPKIGTKNATLHSSYWAGITFGTQKINDVLPICTNTENIKCIRLFIFEQKFSRNWRKF